MSKAREIVEERLAKGEISQAEFDSLVANLSDATSSNKLEDTSGYDKLGFAFELAGTVIGVWLVIGLATYFFMFTPDEQYNRAIKKCGGATPFCACQAKALTDQRSFLSDPLVLIGMKKFRDASAECSHLL